LEIEQKILLDDEVVGVVETVDWKLRYFCEDFQAYKLQRAAWREVAMFGLLNNMTQSCALLVVLLLPE